MNLPALNMLRIGGTYWWEINGYNSLKFPYRRCVLAMKQSAAIAVKLKWYVNLNFKAAIFDTFCRCMLFMITGVFPYPDIAILVITSTWALNK